jgi:hypothetical protein
MSSYYEILNVAPDASVAEIESAHATRYDQLRRLVNHPSQGLSAQQTLMELARAHAVLTDSAKRAAYDQEIGLGAPVGGLADPHLGYGSGPVAPPPLLQSPPVPNGASSAVQPASRAPLWQCSDCATENPPNTQFCLSCGGELVRECPECQKVMSLVATGFCGGCGMHWEAAKERAQLRIERMTTAREWTAARSALGIDARNLGGEFAAVLANTRTLETRVKSINARGLEPPGIAFLGIFPSALVAGIAAPPLQAPLAVVCFCLVLAGAIVHGRNLGRRKASVQRELQAEVQRFADLTANRQRVLQERIDELALSLEHLNEQFEQLADTRRRRPTI